MNGKERNTFKVEPMERIEKKETIPDGRNRRHPVKRRNVLAALAIGATSVMLAPFVFQLLRGPARDTSPEVFRKGQQLNREKRYSEAVEEFTRLIESRKDFSEAYLFRGIAQFNASQFDEAIRDFSKTLELDPQNISVRLYRGESYLATGQKEGAAEDFTAIVQANPPDKRLVAAANAKLQTMGR